MLPRIPKTAYTNYRLAKPGELKCFTCRYYKLDVDKKRRGRCHWSWPHSNAVSVKGTCDGHSPKINITS